MRGVGLRWDLELAGEDSEEVEESEERFKDMGDLEGRVVFLGRKSKVQRR
jgi:hypothetical protein